MEGTIVAVNKAKVYTIHKGGEWARITIEEWDGGGSFQCTSSFGNYNYIWGSIGDITLREFLCSLDYGYFYGKTSSNTTSGQRFSVEKTVAVMKEDVLGSRRNDGITETAAREYFNELNELLDHDVKSEFYSELFRTELFGEFYLGDYSSVYEQFENDPQCNGFWTVLWQDMCEFWKSELQKERPLESGEVYKKNRGNG